MADDAQDREPAHFAVRRCGDREFISQYTRPAGVVAFESGDTPEEARQAAERYGRVAPQWSPLNPVVRTVTLAEARALGFLPEVPLVRD